MRAPADRKPLSGGTIETAEQGYAFLEDLILDKPRPYALRAPFALQAVGRLLARVGNPHHALRVIHIAGSKGKGSTALLIEAILQAAGHRTGTFTSPHLQRWTERYRIDGHEVDETRFAATVEQLRLPVQALHDEDPDHPPSFFDVATAAALLMFQQADVDYAIIEAGLGGRLDATTIVRSAVTCITSIELEHTDKLGTTLAAIAREKAGIIKPGIPVITGALPPSAAYEVRLGATAAGAPLSRLGKEIRWAVEPLGDSGMALRIDSGSLRIDVTLPVLGRHLAQNAALAVACIQYLGDLSDPELSAAARRGLATVQLPGRSEILCRHPWVVVDAAHTPASAQALAEVLTTLPARRVHLILSVSTGKDLKALCAPLLPLTEAVTVTRADPVRSLDPKVIAAAIKDLDPNSRVRIIPDPILAVRSAFQALTPYALLCATGSVYMAGIARTAFAGLKAISGKEAPCLSPLPWR